MILKKYNINLNLLIKNNKNKSLSNILNLFFIKYKSFFKIKF